MIHTYDTRLKNRIRVATDNTEPSMTDPSFQEQSDVNTIIKRYQKTGHWPAKQTGQYMDLSETPDLHTAMDIVTKAQQAFNELPAELRKRFGNSPIELVNYLQDPTNDQEAIKLGLKEKREPQTTTIQTTTIQAQPEPIKPGEG